MSHYYAKIQCLIFSSLFSPANAAAHRSDRRRRRRRRRHLRTVRHASCTTATVDEDDSDGCRHCSCPPVEGRDETLLFGRPDETGTAAAATRRRPAQDQARLESRGVRGRENSRLPVVIPESQMVAQWRDSQHSVTLSPAGQLQPSAAQNDQVSGAVVICHSSVNFFFCSKSLSLSISS